MFNNLNQLLSFDIHDLFDKENPFYTIDYDVVLNNGVKLQRGFCWDLKQKQELIWSMIKGIDILPFHFIIYKEREHQIREIKVIDGKQRLSTISAFYNGEFPIVVKNKEYFFNDFDDDLKYRFLSYHLKGYVKYEYPYRPISDQEKISWFLTVNYAGTAPEEKHKTFLESNLKTFENEK